MEVIVSFSLKKNENHVEYKTGVRMKKEKKERKLPSLQLKMPRYYDKLIHAAILILLFFGSVMIASTTVGQASQTNQNVVVIAIVKQFVFVVGAYILMMIAARNFSKFLVKEVKVRVNQKENTRAKKAYRSFFKVIGFAIFGLCMVTLVSDPVNGSKAWINLKFMTLQPTEFAKVYMIVLIGLIVNDLGPYKVKFLEYARPLLWFFIPIVGILLFQPDTGTLIVFTTLTAVCLLIPTHPALKSLRKFILACLLGVGLLMLFLSTKIGIQFLENFNLGYKFHRFTSAADPFNDVYGEGYNIVSSLSAIANGGLSGLGLGGSAQKFGYLPEAQTDFIFSVVIEEAGMIGLLIIIICYGLLLYRLFYWAIKTKSEGFKVILIGCALYIGIHFILNVGGISALIPLTGVPLLFISSGGSSLLSIMIMMGICQSVISLTKSQLMKQEESKRTPRG